MFETNFTCINHARLLIMEAEWLTVICALACEAVIFIWRARGAYENLRCKKEQKKKDKKEEGSWGGS